LSAPRQTLKSIENIPRPEIKSEKVATESKTTIAIAKQNYWSITENNDSYLVIVELPPAFLRETFEVQFSCNSLQISGKCKFPEALLGLYPGCDRNYAKIFNTTIPLEKSITVETSGILDQSAEGIALIKCMKKQSTKTVGPSHARLPL